MVFRHELEEARLEEARSGTRRAPRRTYRRPMGLLFDGEYQVVEGRQLSEGGARIVVPESLARRWMAGRSGTLTLILPDQPGVDHEAQGQPHDRAMVVRAVAIYQSPVAEGVAMGVKFSDLPFHYRRMIRNYVAAKSADEVAFESQASREGDRFAPSMGSPDQRMLGASHSVGKRAVGERAVGERATGERATGERIGTDSSSGSGFARVRLPQADEEN